jgi:hypothetical protein
MVWTGNQRVNRLSAGREDWTDACKGGQEESNRIWNFIWRIAVMSARVMRAFSQASINRKAMFFAEPNPLGKSTLSRVVLLSSWARR